MRKSIHLLVFLLCVQLARAQPAKSVFFKLATDEWAVPPAQVGASNFFQDKKGFLWLLGERCATHCDGHDCQLLKSNPVDINSLSSSRVRSMRQDEQGNFWLATTNAGLNLWNPTTGKLTHFKHDILFENKDLAAWLSIQTYATRSSLSISRRPFSGRNLCKYHAPIT